MLVVPAGVGAGTLETRCLDGHFHLVNCLSVSFRNYKERERVNVRQSYVHVHLNPTHQCLVSHKFEDAEGNIIQSFLHITAV